MGQNKIALYVIEHARFLTAPGQFGGIDFLRAIAVLSVFFFHFNVLPPGWLGVDLFFVLSGFLIGGSIIDRVERGIWSYATFYGHRALRILPLYYTLVALKSALVGFPLSGMSAKSIASIMTSLTFTQTSSIWYFGWMGDANFVPGGTWSLVIEEYFYLLCPLLIVTVWSVFHTRKALFAAIAAVCLNGAAVRYFANYHYAPDDLYWYFSSWLQFRSRYDTLAFGVLAALIASTCVFNAGQRRAAFVTGVIVLCAVLVYLAHSRMWAHSAQTTRQAALWFPFLLGLSFSLILLAVYRAKCNFVPVIVIARLSFAIYLGHIFLQELFGAYRNSSAELIRWLSEMSPWEMILIFGAATLVLSYLLSLLVEYPFVRLYRKPASAPIKKAIGADMITERGALG